jgi:hypothetical protein
MSIPQNSNKKKDDRRGALGELMAFKGIDEGRKILFSPVPGFKRGGDVKRTGVYKLHKGERVIPAGRSRRGRRGRR